MELCNGWLVIQPQAQVLIQVLEAVSGGIRTEDRWSKKEQDLHINQLDLLAIKFAILTFVKMWKMLAIHIQVENMITLSYLLKIGEKKNPELMQISKKIGNISIAMQIGNLSTRMIFWSKNYSL